MWSRSDRYFEMLKRVFQSFITEAMWAVSSEESLTIKMRRNWYDSKKFGSSLRCMTYQNQWDNWVGSYELLLDARMRKLGASGCVFDFIIASGYRLPTSMEALAESAIQTGETPTMDFGCYYNHYVSDGWHWNHSANMTDEEREIYILFRQQGFDWIAKAGVSRALIGFHVRSSMMGYGTYFTHGIALNWAWYSWNSLLCKSSADWSRENRWAVVSIWKVNMASVLKMILSSRNRLRSIDSTLKELICEWELSIFMIK